MFTSRTLQFKLILFSLVFFSTLFYFLRRTSSVFFVTQFYQRYAYATFLGPPSVSGELDKDPYFTSVRLLAFQILHANRTRTRMEPQIPFLVLALPTVPAAWLAVLASEGAIIVPVAPVDLPATSKDWIARSRFRDVLSKLRLWQLTQYDKVLFLDADTILLAPLDSIFTDPELSRPMSTLQNTSDSISVKGSLPPTYLLSASADTWGDQTEWLRPGHEEYLCACFMLFTPSEDLFNYYQLILSQHKPLFDMNFPEQDLLIYAHRKDGNMPWKRIPIEWSANDGRLIDRLGSQLKSLHIKAWEGANGGNLAGEQTKKLWRNLVQEMENYHA